MILPISIWYWHTRFYRIWEELSGMVWCNKLIFGKSGVTRFYQLADDLCFYLKYCKCYVVFVIFYFAMVRPSLKWDAIRWWPCNFPISKICIAMHWKSNHNTFRHLIYASSSNNAKGLWLFWYNLVCHLENVIIFL